MMKITLQTQNLPKTFSVVLYSQQKTLLQKSLLPCFRLFKKKQRMVWLQIGKSSVKDTYNDNV